jgi:hypothetical protein
MARANDFSARIKRGAYERAGFACEGVLDDGKRCGVTAKLEVHHMRAAADGGKPTLDNALVLCPLCHKPHTDSFAHLRKKALDQGNVQIGAKPKSALSTRKQKPPYVSHLAHLPRRMPVPK